jgi:hypothetical protein
MTIQSKQEYIEKLAILTKNGDRNATDTLLTLFNPLIYKTSKQIYLRYSELFPLDEIIRQSRCILVYLTVSHYQPGGKAHYPHFIKKKLHAELVQLYRPIYTATQHSVPLEYIQDINTTNQVLENERIAICEQILKYANNTLNERDKDIFYGHIYGSIPRNTLAKKYHVSFTRMKVLHKKIIKKLKQYLAKLEIGSIDDI